MPTTSRSRTPAQRRAAQRLARLGRSTQARAAGDPVRRVAPPREPGAPLPPRLAAQLDGFGPSATGWEAELAGLDTLSADFELPPFPAAPLGLVETWRRHV
jgi:hypothetical protein